VISTGRLHIHVRPWRNFLIASSKDSQEGGTVVFRPAKSDKPPQLIASIKIDEWELLARGNLCRAPRAYWSGQGEPPVD
jgi:hypothetical protein